MTLPNILYRDIMVFMKKISSRFKPYCPDQLLLLPPDMRQWLPEGDLAYFIMDVVSEFTGNGTRAPIVIPDIPARNCLRLIRSFDLMAVLSFEPFPIPYALLVGP